MMVLRAHDSRLKRAVAVVNFLLAEEGFPSSRKMPSTRQVRRK